MFKAYEPNSLFLSMIKKLKYMIESDPTVYHQNYGFPILPDCNIYLKHQSAGLLAHQDFPLTAECKVWFPPSPENSHGLVIELLKLNVPCSKGYIQFSGVNGSLGQHQHASGLHGNRHLCGKLEELADADRHIYFSSTLHAQPFMHVQGYPMFSVSYRLVDYCYNVTFLAKNGSFELEPTGELQCTFKIYLPYGNRVSLKLVVGDTTAIDPPDTSLTFKDLISGDVSCQGLLIRLFDSGSTWSHCTKQGDTKRQIDILSKENKIVIKVSLGKGLKGVPRRLSLRMSYTAEPIEEIVGTCDFGWVAQRQFCIAVLENFRLSWSDAEKECSNMGGHLVSIRSQHAQSVVNRLLTNRALRNNSQMANSVELLKILPKLSLN